MLKLWNKNDLGDTDLWKVMQFTSVYVLFADLIWKVYFYCCNVCQNVVVQDNERSRDIMIDHRFHKTIIGAQGAGIRDIRDKFGGVVVSFPDPSRQSDVVSLRGPKDDVDQCYKYLHQLAQDMVLLHYVLPEFPMKYFYRTILCMCGTSRGPLSVCVCLSVTSRCYTKMARITQRTPHSSPWTLLFWCQRSTRNSTGVTMGAPNAGGVGQNRRVSITGYISKTVQDKTRSFC